jgi:uncharacterized membrane protein
MADLTPFFATTINLAPRVLTFLIAMLPISELRGAIPYGLWVGKLGWKEVYIIAVLGNFLPVIPLLMFMERASEWLRRYPMGDRFFTWFFNRTRRRGKLIDRFEAIGLTMFVAIPLPVTGAWTGCAAAIIFGIPRKRAIPTILLGIMLAGCIVTLASMGIISFWGIDRAE